MPRDVEIILGATSTLRRRIAAKIQRGRRNECWVWLGGKARKRGGAMRPKIQIGGRGSRVVVVARLLIALRDRQSLASRDGLEAGHTCGHFWCVNPRHLEWQGRSENEDAKSEFDESVDDGGFTQWADDMDAILAGGDV